MENGKCSENDSQSSRIHCFMTIRRTHVRSRKTMVVTERHTTMHKISHLRSEIGCAKLDSWPGGGGKAGVGYGDVIISSDGIKASHYGWSREKLNWGRWQSPVDIGSRRLNILPNQSYRLAVVIPNRLHVLLCPLSEATLTAPTHPRGRAWLGSQHF